MLSIMTDLLSTKQRVHYLASPLIKHKSKTTFMSKEMVVLIENSSELLWKMVAGPIIARIISDSLFNFLVLESCDISGPELVDCFQ